MITTSKLWLSTFHDGAEFSTAFLTIVRINSIRWGTCFSNFFSLQLEFVLSPCLFNNFIFVDNIVYKLQMSGFSAHVKIGSFIIIIITSIHKVHAAVL